LVVSHSSQVLGGCCTRICCLARQNPNLGGPPAVLLNIPSLVLPNVVGKEEPLGAVRYLPLQAPLPPTRVVGVVSK
jgi:hypothetical protein